MIWVATNRNTDLAAFSSSDGPLYRLAWRLVRDGQVMLLAAITDDFVIVAQPAAGVTRSAVEVPEIADAVGELVLCMNVEWSADSTPSQQHVSPAMAARLGLIPVRTS
jgi:hypothetical protein